jgi:hypothetical protein
MPRRRPPLALVAALAATLAAGAVGALAWAGAAPATAAPASPQAGSDRWAFIVGVSDYAGRTSSTVAGADDAADFRELLLRNGFREDRIRTITDAQATARNVRAGLQWLVDNSSPESFSVFHFSGHVKQLGGDRDRDGEKVDEYLWPHDNVFISDAELASRVQQLRGLAWIDIAGCEAGGFDDGISSPTRVFTGSSRETEKSYEHPDWRNSVFTGLQVDQGWLQGQADHDANGKVSIQEAFAFAHERAPRITAGQRRGPQHPVSAGGDGSQWFLDGPPPPPAPAPEPDGRCRQLVCFRR